MDTPRKKIVFALVLVIAVLEGVLLIVLPRPAPVQKSIGTLVYQTFAGEAEGYNITEGVDQRDGSVTERTATVEASDANAIPNKVVGKDVDGDDKWDELKFYRNSTGGYSNVVLADTPVCESASDDGTGRVSYPSAEEIARASELLDLVPRIETAENLVSETVADITSERNAGSAEKTGK